MGPLAFLQDVWKRFEIIIGPFWAALDALVGASWGCCGALLSRFGGSWACLGALLGPFWGLLVPSLDHFEHLEREKCKMWRIYKNLNKYDIVGFPGGPR